MSSNYTMKLSVNYHEFFYLRSYSLLVVGLELSIKSLEKHHNIFTPYREGTQAIPPSSAASARRKASAVLRTANH